MTKIPKVSICVPTYNGSEFLEECINSCLSQTFNNFEVIILDDGSTDETVDIAKKYLYDSRVKLFTNSSNLGLVNNWNKCIDLAKGEWIKFVFQDDYIEPDCLKNFIQHIDDDIFLLVSKRSFIFSKDTSAIDKQYYNSRLRTLNNTRATLSGNKISPDVISKVACENIALNFIGEPSLTMFKKDIVKKIGYFNTNLVQICDFEFFLRLASNYGLIYIPEKLCHFRVHKASASSANLATKLFILSYLDPVILVRQVLFDDQYKLSRSFLSPLYLFKLRNFLNVRAFEARINSKANNLNKMIFEEVKAKFSEIKEYSEDNFIIWLKYLLILLSRRIKNLIARVFFH